MPLYCVWFKVLLIVLGLYSVHCFVPSDFFSGLIDMDLVDWPLNHDIIYEILNCS